MTGRRLSRAGTAQVHYTLAAVARRLGVAPSTLRTWDLRYGVGPGEHIGGTRRRYSAVDLSVLQDMVALIQEGVAPAEAARHARRGRGVQLTVAGSDRRPAPPLSSVPIRSVPAGRVLAVAGPDPVVRGLGRAALALDEQTVTRLMHRAVAERGLVRAWGEVFTPVLAAAGDRWAATGEGVEIEHLLSECAIACLRAGAAPAAASPAGRRVLLACADRERHTLPLYALAAALAERRVPSRVLGPATPAAALRAAAERTGPTAVFVWSHLPRTSGTALWAALRAQRPAPRLLAGGPGWPRARLPVSVQWIGSLAAAVDVLQDLP